MLVPVPVRSMMFRRPVPDLTNFAPSGFGRLRAERMLQTVIRGRSLCRVQRSRVHQKITRVPQGLHVSVVRGNVVKLISGNVVISSVVTGRVR